MSVKYMMIMHKLQQLDTEISNDFKRSYLESPSDGFAERIQMSIMAVMYAVIAVLSIFAHTNVYMIAIFTAVSLLFSGWSLYSWRTYFILRKDGKNLDEPLFIHGPVSAWRIILFVPAAIVVLQMIFSPGLYTKIFGYHAGSLHRPLDFVYPIAMAIVMVEYWRFSMIVKNWTTRRHLIFVFLLAIAGIAIFWYIVPMHRPPTFIDLT